MRHSGTASTTSSVQLCGVLQFASSCGGCVTCVYQQSPPTPEQHSELRELICDADVSNYMKTQLLLNDACYRRSIRFGTSAAWGLTLLLYISPRTSNTPPHPHPHSLFHHFLLLLIAFACPFFLRPLEISPHEIKANFQKLSYYYQHVHSPATLLGNQLNCLLTQTAHQPITLQRLNEFRHADVRKTTHWRSKTASASGRRGVLSDFESDSVFGARWAGLSISQIAHRLWFFFLHTNHL